MEVTHLACSAGGWGFGVGGFSGLAGQLSVSLASSLSTTFFSNSGSMCVLMGSCVSEGCMCLWVYVELPLGVLTAAAGASVRSFTTPLQLALQRRYGGCWPVRTWTSTNMIGCGGVRCRV